MPYDFNNQTPIYLQIIEEITRKIIIGDYALGQKIPSVRELASQFEVNPNTIQKALTKLEEDKLIVTESTNGKFVTKDSGAVNSVREKTVKGLIDKFYDSMGAIGIDREKALKILNGR